MPKIKDIQNNEDGTTEYDIEESTDFESNGIVPPTKSAYELESPPISLFELEIMSRICNNLYQTRGGNSQSKSLYDLSIELMGDMLVAYSKTIPVPETEEPEISESLEISAETP